MIMRTSCSTIWSVSPLFSAAILKEEGKKKERKAKGKRVKKGSGWRKRTFESHLEKSRIYNASFSWIFKMTKNVAFFLSFFLISSFSEISSSQKLNHFETLACFHLPPLPNLKMFFEVED
jgi:hypothetical protein